MSQPPIDIFELVHEIWAAVEWGTSIEFHPEHPKQMFIRVGGFDESGRRVSTAQTFSLADVQAMKDPIKTIAESMRKAVKL